MTHVRFSVISAALLVLGTKSASADEVGRYQILILPSKGSVSADRVMILDTKDGNLWEWWDQSAVGTVPASTGISYMGKLTPGDHAGDTMPIERKLVAGTTNIQNAQPALSPEEAKRLISK
jgi:hypothetical protein